MAKKNEITFDVVAKKKLFITIPLVILAVTIAVGLIFGAEISIEFTGGTILTYSYTGKTVDINDVSSAIDALGFGSAAVTAGSAFGMDVELINISFTAASALSTEQQSAITSMLTERYPGRNMALENNLNVSASTGRSFFLKCLVAFVFAFIMFILYIAYRFKKIGGWATGIFALLGLMIDVVVVVAVFIFFRLPIDPIFMAVVLTIMGYSINNTIILYDRVRENKTLQGRQLSPRELVNLSIRQSLSRTINTTVTTAAALLALSIVAVIFGVTTILNFAFPMTIGLISGVYTTLCLSGTFWVMWQERKGKKA